MDLIFIKRKFRMFRNGNFYNRKPVQVAIFLTVVIAVLYLNLHSKNTQAVPIIRYPFRECVKELSNVGEGSIANAVEFAVKTSLQNKPNCFPKDQAGKILPYKVLPLRVTGLICPGYKLGPNSVPNIGYASVPDALNAKNQLISSTTYNWGRLFSFSLLFHQPNEVQEDQKHSYLIFEFGDNQFYIFQHTFSPKHSTQDTKPFLKVMTFNTWNVESQPGGLDYVSRIKSLIKLGRESGADILGFQEVQFHDTQGGVLGPNQMGHFANLLPEYQYVFQPAEIHDYGHPMLVVEGVALFSKYPITYHDHVFLKRNNASNPKDTQRMLLHIEVEMPSVGKIHAYVTHMSPWHYNGRARQTNVMEIWKHMELSQGPAFLMGDMNAKPNSKEIRFLNGDVELNGIRTKGLKDAAILKHGTDDIGYTCDQMNKLSRRLDYIFMRQHGSMRVQNIYLIGKTSNKLLAPSDHVGVLAEFGWKKM